MEFFSPPVRDPVFNLIFELLNIRLLWKGLAYRLLMELVKLVVEFCDHLLDVLSFLLLVKFVYNGLLNVSLRVSGDNGAIWTNNQLSLYLANNRLLPQNLFDRGILVLL